MPVDSDDTQGTAPQDAGQARDAGDDGARRAARYLDAWEDWLRSGGPAAEPQRWEK